MPFPSVTSADAVRAAITEYDEIGAEAFHKKYGFGPAQDYYLVDNGRRYDSKAILAAAQGFQHPESGPMPNQFSGGKPVKKALERLGFIVEEPGDSDR